MKTLKLNPNAFAGATQLSRAEMKNVMGGSLEISLSDEACGQKMDPCGPKGCCPGLDCSDDVCVKE